MVDGLDDKIDNNKQNPESSEDLLKKFRDNLKYLASEVYETSKNAYHKSLQSLEKGLGSQKKEVQESTVDALSTLRDTLDKKAPSDSPVAATDVYRVSEGKDFADYDRSDTVNQGLVAASEDVSTLIASSSKDANLVASTVGRWMQKILDTEL